MTGTPMTLDCILMFRLVSTPHYALSFSFTDILSASEFISGDLKQNVTWDAFDDGEHLVLTTRLETPQAFTEYANFIQDATEFFGFKHVSCVYLCLSEGCSRGRRNVQIANVSTTWQAGTQDSIIRTAVGNMSVQLNNSLDTTPRYVDE